MAGNKVTPILIETLSQDRPEDVPVVQAALLSYTDRKAVPLMGKAVPGMPSAGRIALMEILAQRQANDYLPVIWEQTQEKDPAVRLAAIKALKPLVSDKDLSASIDLLLKSRDESLSASLLSASLKFS